MCVVNEAAVSHSICDDVSVIYAAVLLNTL